MTSSDRVHHQREGHPFQVEPRGKLGVLISEQQIIVPEG